MASDSIMSCAQVLLSLGVTRSTVSALTNLSASKLSSRPNNGQRKSPRMRDISVLMDSPAKKKNYLLALDAFLNGYSSAYHEIYGVPPDPARPCVACICAVLPPLVNGNQVAGGLDIHAEALVQAVFALNTSVLDTSSTASKKLLSRAWTAPVAVSSEPVAEIADQHHAAASHLRHPPVRLSRCPDCERSIVYFTSPRYQPETSCPSCCGWMKESASIKKVDPPARLTDETCLQVTIEWRNARIPTATVAAVKGKRGIALLNKISCDEAAMQKTLRRKLGGILLKGRLQKSYYGSVGQKSDLLDFLSEYQEEYQTVTEQQIQAIEDLARKSVQDRNNLMVFRENIQNKNFSFELSTIETPEVESLRAGINAHINELVLFLKNSNAGMSGKKLIGLDKRRVRFGAVGSIATPLRDAEHRIAMLLRAVAESNRADRDPNSDPKILQLQEDLMHTNCPTRAQKGYQK